jgi:lipopolysaccharide transport system ATP-binding protein
MNAIEIQNLTKIYKLYNSPSDRLKEALHPLRKKMHTDFYALNNVSFELKKGENLGILGKNGSGKSTLLKIITGVLTPSSGKVSVHGKVSSLLELGTGFNPELTGMENIFFYGLINGLNHEEIEKNVDKILSFADIGPFINQPMKSYSSGMFVRLAFSCAVQIEPEIFIVDEALSVGDAKFQSKSFGKIKRMIDSGCTFIFVSHSTEQIVSHCNTAIFLKEGRVQSMGEPRKMVNLYLDDLFGKQSSGDREDYETTSKESKAGNFTESVPKITEIDSLDKFEHLSKSFEERKLYNPNEYRWGDRKAILKDFCLMDKELEIESGIKYASNLSLFVSVEVKEEISHPILGLAIKTKEGITIYNSNTKINGTRETYIESLKPGDKFVYNVNFNMNLGNGDYFISLGLASESAEGEVVPHDRRYDSIHLNTYGADNFYGISNIFSEFSIL